MTIAWKAPRNNGGCPLTGYTVKRDDGSSQVTNIDVSSPNIPTQSQATAVLNIADHGKTFKYQVTAINKASYTVISNSDCFPFIVKPGTPSAPTIAASTDHSITVTFVSVDNGGGVVQSYHLQYGTTYSGDWIDILGYPDLSLTTIYTLENL